MVVAAGGELRTVGGHRVFTPLMRLRLFILTGLFSLVGLLGLAGAEPDFLADFPPLRLVGQDKRATEAFKNSGTTIELYKKYHNFARAIKAGNTEKMIRANLERDIAHWKVEASRKFFFPKKPNSTDKKVIDDYEARRAKAQAVHDRKIAVAETYLTWLEVEIPAWIEKAK